MALQGVQLSRAGYHITSRRDNPACRHCTELLLVCDPCGATEAIYADP